MHQLAVARGASLSRLLWAGFVVIMLTTIGLPQYESAWAQTLNRRLYLPNLANGYPDFKKPISGVHLGSASNQTWTTAMTQRLTGPGGPGAQGYYPGIIVVLSSDLYFLTRSTVSPCNVAFVSAVKNQALFNYVKDASQRGTRVVIRIWPSPGNYRNAFGAASGKVMLEGVDERPLRIPSPPTPVDWCTSADQRALLARNGRDVANEIVAIRNYNTSMGWSAFAFEPANEPNVEWLTTNDLRVDPQQWFGMDNYLANIYSLIRSNSGNADIRIHAAPMSQSAFAEQLNVLDCSNYGFGDGGMALMTKTWINGSQAPAFSDGWSWHNYWKYGEEASTTDNSCSNLSGHNFQAFPPSLKSAILAGARSALITEADVFSPCIGDASLLPDKGELASTSGSTNSANAIRVFIQNNRAANLVAVWNITVAGSDDTNCSAALPNSEFAWHEAFRGAGERAWFRIWWVNGGPVP